MWLISWKKMSRSTLLSFSLYHWRDHQPIQDTADMLALSFELLLGDALAVIYVRLTIANSLSPYP
jgi:hypothetical protein